MKDQHRKLAVLADDLTGALDCAAAFLDSGFSSFVSIGLKVPANADFDLLSLNMDTRRLDLDKAKSRLSRSIALVREVDAEPVYVKIDSTLRGHPGLEISGIAKMTGSERTLVCPAFPATGRTVRGGALSIDGTPLAQTEVGRDPLSPATSSNVAEILSAHSSAYFSEIGLQDVRSGDLVNSMEIKSERNPVLICCDAETNNDLGRVAEAGLELSKPLFAGSAGLAAALARKLSVSPVSSLNKEVWLTDGPILLITASQRSLADRQIEHASQAMGLKVFPVGFSVESSAMATPVFDREAAREAMSQGANLALRASISSDIGSLDPSRIRELADTVTDQLSHLLADLCDAQKPAAAVLIGGDTAFALLTELGADGIFLVSQPIPGVAVGTAFGGTLDGSIIATKAGAFGDESTVTETLKYLLRHRTQN